MTNNPGLLIFKHAQKHSQREALVDKAGSHTYQKLLQASCDVASALLAEKHDLQEARVAFLIPPSFEYTAILWEIWRAGGIAVPLCITHPVPELARDIRGHDTNLLRKSIRTVLFSRHA